MRIFNYTDIGDYMEDKKQGWVVRVGEGFFIKRTSQFGMFHGSIYLTVDREDARIWSREGDAKDKADVYRARVNDELSPNPRYADYPKTAKHEPR